MRLIVAIVVLLAAAAATVVAVLPFIVSTDAIRIRVAQEISAWTGYSVELRQPPRLKVFPVLQASLSQVTLSRLGVSGGKPLMSADRIDVELSPLDALLGHISFSETQIIRPHFRLDEPVGDLPQILDALASSDGRLGVAIRAARELAQKSDTDPAVGRQASQPFGRIVIRDGTLDYRRFGSPVEEQITAINATLDWPQTTSAANLQGSANWRGENTDFSFSAAQPLPLLAGGISPFTASITAKPLTLNFDGKANISKDRFFEGSLSANFPALSNALRWAGLPPAAGTAQLGAVSLESTVTVTPTRLKFADVVLTTDKNPAKGVIEIGLDQNVPTITGTLAFQTLDLRNLFSAFIPLPFTASGMSPEERASSDVIDTRFVERAELDLRLSAQNATLGPVALTGVAAAVQVRSGRAIFDIGDAKTFKGSVQANIQVARDLNGTTGELRFNGTDIDSADLISALGLGKPFVTARGNVSLFMKAPLKNWSTLLTSAEGNTSLNFGGGQMLGFDLKDFIAKASTDRFFALERKENVSLGFNRLDVKANLADGVATLENARVETSSGILTLAGIVPFLDRSLALSGEVSLPVSQTPPAPAPAQAGTGDNNAPAASDQPAAAQPAAPAPIHFFVGGSWDRPFISPSSNTPTTP